MNVGGTASAVQVTVRDTVAVLPQPSVALNVLVCDLLHVPVASPSLDVMVGEPVQLSVAVAPFNAAVIADAAGPQPNGTVA